MKFKRFLLVIIAFAIVLSLHVLNARSAYLARKQRRNLCVQGAGYHNGGQ